MKNLSLFVLFLATLPTSSFAGDYTCEASVSDRKNAPADQMRPLLGHEEITSVSGTFEFYFQATGSDRMILNIANKDNRFQATAVMTSAPTASNPTEIDLGFDGGVASIFCTVK